MFAPPNTTGFPIAVGIILIVVGLQPTPGGDEIPVRAEFWGARQFTRLDATVYLSSPRRLAAPVPLLWRAAV